MGGLKRVVITGGTGGLGMAIAAVFREKGWEVSALGRKDLNLANVDAVGRFFAEQSWDLLVCAAGIIRDEPLARIEESSWDDVVAVNFTAAAVCAAAMVPGMISRGRGHVIFISSYAALHPAAGQAAYAAAKAALLGLAKDLAERHGREGLRFNAVLPGFLETPMTDAVSPRRKEAIRSLHHLGEFNTPAAAAEFVWFLEERMPMTSGQVFQLDSRP
jgi:3-oxoacyl-[acyl-carrier protein] reductase